VLFRSFIHIFSHYDADGISSAGILARSLLRAGKDFSVTLFTALNDENMNTIEKSNAKCVIIADMGASYLDDLDTLEKDVIVLDHHRAIRGSEKICFANPHLFGIDGMTECCAASLSLLFAAAMDESNLDLSQIAFAGIAGDRQHINISGINAHILRSAAETGYVTARDGSLIPSGPLSRELYLTTEPYISGISGSPEGVSKLMKDSEISRDRSSSDLNDSERRKLSSLIAIILASENVMTKTVSESSRTRYDLRDWHMDAEAFADILNACGRLGFGGIGVAMCLGDERSRIEAEGLNDDYRSKIVTAAKELDRRGLIQMRNIQYFDSSASGFTGVLCSIAMQYLGDHGKPAIGMNVSEDVVKASARGTMEQLERGIDLSAGMEAAAKEAGGQGGGHRIASGASIPKGSEEVFLNALDRIVGEQISAK
jgi:RecJ-like exonuclease